MKKYYKGDKNKNYRNNLITILHVNFLSNHMLLNSLVHTNPLPSIKEHGKMIIIFHLMN
jgi:hypothetical protein